MQSISPAICVGPPFLHVWVDVLEALIQSPKTLPEALTELTKYWQEQILKLSVLELADKVRVCMVRKTYEKATKQLHMRFDDIQLEHAVARAVVSNGGIIKVGAPPRSALEREAQELLGHLDQAKD